ncbi:MAG: Cellulophaga phage phi10:1 [Bacteroidota bacterium]|jgi:HK97 family phage major capsid protein
MEELKKFEDALASKLSEMKAEVSANTEKAAKQFEDKVSQVNEQLVKSNASLEEARKEVLEAKAALGKIAAKEEVKVATSYAEHINNIKVAIADAVTKGWDDIKSAARNGGKGFSYELDQKAVGTMTISNNLTGSVYTSYVDNPALRSFVNPHLRSVFNIIPVSTGSVSFPRGNTPVGEGSFGKQTEGSAKPQVDYDVTVVNTALSFIAGYAKVSRQMIDDLPFLQAYLQQSLIEDFQKAEDTYYLNAIAASATAGSSSGANTAEKFIDYLAQLGALNWTANLALTTHAGWAGLLKTKPSDYSVPGGMVIDQNGNVRIAGVPVVPHSLVTASKIYVMDTTKFAIAQQSGLSVRSTEFDQDDFIKNLITFRCEARCELLQFQPGAAVYGAI